MKAVRSGENSGRGLVPAAIKIENFGTIGDQNEQASTAKDVFSAFDIGVDGKFGQVVMLMANAKGRKIVDDTWPDVEWTTDATFAATSAPDWLFTHVRVTKLPTHFESKTPLSFASPEAISFAAAASLQRKAPLRRVAYFTGSGLNAVVNFFDGRIFNTGDAADFACFAEHVPAGTLLGAPEGVH